MTTLYESLVRYAVDRNLLQRPYYADQKFVWELLLTFDGSLASPDLLRLPDDLDARGKPSKTSGRTEAAPNIKRTRGDSAILGADSLEYVLGWHDPAPEAPAAEEKGRVDATRRHGTWDRLTREWAASPHAAHDPVPAALVRFLDEGVDRIRRPDKWTAKDRVLIRVGTTLATDSASASRYWAEHVEAKKGSTRSGHCVICGQRGSLVATLPQSVKGTLIPGGHTSGVAPISINEAVYGYDLRKGLDHVPVCHTCAQAIPTALEHLLSDPDKTHRTPQSATTWWVEGSTAFDPFSTLALTQDNHVRDFIQRVESGAGTARALVVDHFHALSLEGNGPRLVVRDWTHLPVRTIQENILAWFRDTRIKPLWPDGAEYHSLVRLAMATGRHDRTSNRYSFLSDPAGRHPHAITETLREVALRRRPLPRGVATHLLQRIMADGHVDDARIALLRLFLTRSTTKDLAMAGLDPTHRDPSYVLGRLMAVYERMQYAAARLGSSQGPNATFADKFLAGAISSPILVLTSGGKQAQAWRAKLRRNQKYTYDSNIEAITSLLDPADPPPVRASIEQQASFLLGYHHQRAHDNEETVAAKVKKLASTSDDND